MKCLHCFQPMKMYYVGLKCPTGSIKITYICQNTECPYLLEQIKERELMIEQAREKEVKIEELKGGMSQNGLPTRIKKTARRFELLETESRTIQGESIVRT